MSSFNQEQEIQEQYLQILASILNQQRDLIVLGDARRMSQVVKWPTATKRVAWDRAKFALGELGNGLEVESALKTAKGESSRNPVI